MVTLSVPISSSFGHLKITEFVVFIISVANRAYVYAGQHLIPFGISLLFISQIWNCMGHGGAVVTHSPPTPEVCRSNPRPYVGKLVVADHWSAAYGTEP